MLLRILAYGKVGLLVSNCHDLRFLLRCLLFLVITGRDVCTTAGDHTLPTVTRFLTFILAHTFPFFP